MSHHASLSDLDVQALAQVVGGNDSWASPGHMYGLDWTCRSIAQYAPYVAEHTPPSEPGTRNKLQELLASCRNDVVSIGNTLGIEPPKP